MKRFLITLGILAVAIAGIVFLQHYSGVSSFLWSVSNKGAWLLPLVLVAALLDSVHPCSFSILLITIAFLFGMQLSRKKILQIGGTYIAGIVIAYFAIGLGILGTINFFNVPHFMGKLGAVLLIGFGILNILNEFFPEFPIRLKLPSVAYTKMGKLMEQASIPAAFVLGLLVGICQFPCMGGPYLMVIGLLHDHATYFTGLGYLTLYNLILVLPLVVVLWISADKAIVAKAQEWKKNKAKGVRLWAGIVMIILGFLIFTL
jgi:cytochrome c biogenesis protein CcdA